ncbi:uncharacterized protein LOC125776238 [Bactrocera dorsalis]|uniref:Phosphatidylinositol-glycan biosynthesis class W protein n=1 Tax=Bactrocera dorsalis TaxID=27457 RepID=A0ABM3J2G1_BACDO|nr:uncharacterized protein LOC125776238 [Bactrocera dorsalis]
MDYGDDDEIIVPVWSEEAEILPFEDYYSPAPNITALHAESWEILYHVGFILESLLAVIFFFAITRVFNQKMSHIFHPDSFKRYFYELLFIIAPTVLFVIVLHRYIYAVIIVFAISVIYALFRIYKTKAQQRWYITGGRRPFILTLNRATIYLITALCILAEDFQCFPKYFQMSHGQGVGLKDALAGFYVFTMATVERNKNKIYGIRRTLTALLLLWLGEYVGSKYVIYSHDENVYGKHWNVFVTLALTKCIGAFYCTVFKSRTKQLYVGGVLLILHQCALRVFFNNVVLDEDYIRDNLYSQNREGLLSLPGFVALYFISVYIGRCLRVQDIILSYYDLIYKVKVIGITCVTLWILVFSCAFTISISHITCNAGYVLWILAMTLTMTFVSIVVFHLVINTLWFLDKNDTYYEIYYGTVLKTSDIPRYRDLLPMIVEAINKNGFLFFVLTILCARLNVITNPMVLDSRFAFFMLFNSLLFATGIVSLLHHFKIRIYI